jgi:hypothetical protein
MPSNLFNTKPIELNDQGFYYAVNRKTGGINNVFQLVCEEDEWYLYQLKNIDKEGGMAWVILADQGDYALAPVDADEVQRYFSKPEYLEPKGNWQVMRNARYGFGKFTPESLEMNVSYGMILFSGDDMLVPLFIAKAEDGLAQSLAEIAK